MEAQQPIQLREGFKSVLNRIPHYQKQGLQLSLEIDIGDISPHARRCAIVAGLHPVGRHARGEVVDVMVLYAKGEPREPCWNIHKCGACATNKISNLAHFVTRFHELTAVVFCLRMHIQPSAAGLSLGRSVRSHSSHGVVAKM